MNLYDYAVRINQCAVDHGFWEEDRNFGEMIALMHSELSEALEAHRDGLPDFYFQCVNCGETNYVGGLHCDAKMKPEGTAIELLDCVIRILDTLYAMKLPVSVDDLARMKIMYNESRPYKHGKKY